MKFSRRRQESTFTRSQRKGLFLLIILIVVMQTLIFLDFPPHETTGETNKWLAVQDEIDSLKVVRAQVVKPKQYPFNPNFITDFKGYRLGMSTEEIDRLLAFRAQGKFVNSAAEFQKVTHIHDTLLAKISPLFKFPEWVTNKKRYPDQKVKSGIVVMTDINLASKDELMKVYGIGPALSDRIIKQREILGGFVDMAQMEDIWGLSPEVIENLRKHFTVKSDPEVRKIDINNASIKELSQFPYFRYALAKDIVAYRSMNGGIKSTDDLAKVPNFPVEKVKIIAVYLTL